MPTKKSFNRIAIAAHPDMEGAGVEAERISNYLKSQNVEVWSGWLYDRKLLDGLEQGQFDLWIALGGDGTMLRSGHICAPVNVPILGINVGRLGFLLEIQRDEWQDMLPRVLAGEYWVERRMMLQVEQRRKEECLGTWEVLNEAMVGRGQIMRPVHLTTEVDGLRLATYVADGVITATPTGSTAYALAAGGPILPPELRNILVVPVAPHLTVDRAIVLAEGSLVRITVHTDHHAVLSLDGQTPVTLEDGDQVLVQASEHTAQFIRLQDRGYFYRNINSRMVKNLTIGTKE